GACVGGRVDELCDLVGARGERGEPAGRERRAPLLQLQRADDREQVGVAAALPVPVGRALDVHGAAGEGDQGVGDRAAGVLVEVAADPRLPDEAGGGRGRGRRAGGGG